MAAKVYLSEDGYSIRGAEPPGLRAQPDAVRLMFWGWLMEAALRAKDRDLSRGLDKDGRPLRPISAYTRRHRHSAMTPTGRGDPKAPPLEPGRQKSRVRSLLTGRAFVDHAAFWWRFDPHIGDSFARVLEAQKEHGRDVFGLSPAALKRSVAQAWEKYARWEAGKAVEMPVVIGVPQARPVVAVGRTNTQFVTFGIGAAGAPAGQWSGGMRIEDWFRHMRQPQRVEIPARTTTSHNRLLGHIWGPGGAPGRPAAKAPKPVRPKPRPKPAATPAATPTPAPTATGPRIAVRGNVPADQVELLQRVVDALPRAVLDRLAAHGTGFVFAEDMATFDPALAAERPRGWPEGSTWRNVDGLYNPGLRAVVATRYYEDRATGTRQISYRSAGNMRHETGHALDAALNQASLRREFTAAHAEDAAALSDDQRPALAYYLQAGIAGWQEAFAEIFAQMYGGGARSIDLAQWFPRCAALMRRWAEGGWLP